MIPLSAEEAGAALGRGPLVTDVPAVCIDSRAVEPGCLFIAIPGERYDGHDFVATALAAGAAGAVVSEEWHLRTAAAADPGAHVAHPGAPGEGEDVATGGGQSAPLYPVPDTRAALGRLARAVRRRSPARVVGITGSMGKTGTKDLLRAMLARVGRVASTAANQNNEIGVPLTLLGLDSATDFAVVELGMRGRGQIAELARYVEPDVGLITNVAPVHLELLGTLEEIARAKAELLGGLRPGGTGVIPADAPLLEAAARESGAALLRFAVRRVGGPSANGKHPPVADHSLSADLNLYYRVIGESRSEIEVEWPEGRVELEVPWTSGSRMANAAAAAAACLAAGADMRVTLPGLADARFSPSRGDEFVASGVLVLDDSYNANPVAVEAAIDALVERAALRGGRPIAVLGDMLELGPDEATYHERVGRYARAAGVAGLIGVGPLSRATVEGYVVAGDGGPATDAYAGGPSPAGDTPESEEANPLVEPSAARRYPGPPAHHLTDAPEAFSVLDRLLRPGDVVLVKASRGLRLERITEHLRARS